MVDQRTLSTSDPSTFERFTDTPGKFRQCFDALTLQFLPMIFDKKEPVPSPGNVTCHLTMTCNLNAHIFGIAISGHVVNRDATILKQFCRHHSYRCLDAVLARLDATQMSKRS